MRRWGTLLTAALVLSGCDDFEAADRPLPTVTHEKAAIPKDRDREAVLAAIRRLEPCALLDPGDQPLGGIPADVRPMARAFFDCNLLVKNAEGVYFGVEDLGTDERQTLAQEPVGDARAYLRSDGDSCVYYLPVSFSLAIKISVLLEDTDDPCVPAKAFAEQVVTRLSGDLADYETEPRWDACSVLVGILDKDPAKVSSGSLGDGLSSCRDSEETSPLFAFDYDDEKIDADDTIAGVPVDVSDGSNCWVRWQHSDKAPPYADRPHTQAMVLAPDCGTATSVARQAIEFLREPPPADNPQRPVLYGPDEPDVPIPGACRYFPVEMPDCQPYVEVPVPQGTAEILRQAEADKNVICAISIAAVRKHFDKTMEAITSEQRGCDYFAASARYTVKVSLDTFSLSLHGKSEGTQVGDHPAMMRSEEGFSDLSVAVTPDPEADGVLVIAVKARYGEGETPEEKALNMDTLKAAAKEVLDKHFR